jgi:hypothetical protein
VRNNKAGSWVRLNGAASSTAAPAIKKQAQQINALRNYAFGVPLEAAALLASTRSDLVL